MSQNNNAMKDGMAILKDVEKQNEEIKHKIEENNGHVMRQIDGKGNELADKITNVEKKTEEIKHKIEENNKHVLRDIDEKAKEMSNKITDVEDKIEKLRIHENKEKENVGNQGVTSYNQGKGNNGDAANQGGVNRNLERGNYGIVNNQGVIYINQVTGTFGHVGNQSVVINNQGRGNNGDEQGQNTLLTPKILDRVSYHIGDQWRSFGAWLNLSDVDLQHIEHNRHRSLQEKTMGVLTKWEQKVGKPSWEQLKEILIAHDRKDVVTKIEKEFNLNHQG